MNHSPDDQLMIRSFNREKDLAGLVELRAEIEAFDHAGNEVSESALIETLNWPGHDPQNDRWVIEYPERPGQLVGHAWARTQSSERTIVYVAIHPDWRRKGLGGALLERTVKRAVQNGATHVTAGADIQNKGADAFLRQQGFHLAGNNRFMRAPTDIPLQEPVWPAGYTVRSYAEFQELSRLVEAFNRCYGDMWGHTENTPGAMNEEHLIKIMNKYPDRYNPEGIFMAFAPDGDIAGVCLAMITQSEDGQVFNIDSPGVVPELRHLGLQRPLTLTAMHWLRAQGAGPIDLETYGDSQEAFMIYQALGFVLTEHYVEYCRYLN